MANGVTCWAIHLIKGQLDRNSDNMRSWFHRVLINSINYGWQWIAIYSMLYNRKAFNLLLGDHVFKSLQCHSQLWPREQIWPWFLGGSGSVIPPLVNHSDTSLSETIVSSCMQKRVNRAFLRVCYIALWCSMSNSWVGNVSWPNSGENGKRWRFWSTTIKSLYLSFSYSYKHYRLITCIK